MGKRIGHGVVVLAALALFPVAAAAQGPAVRGGFWLAVGPFRHGQTDLMASPMRFHGTAAGLALGYRRVSRTRFGVDASFSRAELASRLNGDNRGETAYLLTVEARWLAPLAGSGPWRLYAGGQVDIYGPARSHRYTRDGTEVYADLFVPLHAALAQELDVGPGWVVTQRLAVPVAAVVARSPYSGFKYWPSVELAAPGRFLGLEHAVGVDHPLSDAWGVHAEWRTTLLRYPDPRELSMVTHRMVVGLELHP